MVGGPAKANDLGKLGQVIKIYQDEAAIRGVGLRRILQKVHHKCN